MRSGRYLRRCDQPVGRLGVRLVQPPDRRAGDRHSGVPFRHEEPVGDHRPEAGLVGDLRRRRVPECCQLELLDATLNQGSLHAGSAQIAGPGESPITPGVAVELPAVLPRLSCP